MPQKQKSKSWAELKQAGNECFKTGQYGDATNLYSQAIKELEKSSECYLNITCRYLTLQRTVRNNEHKHSHVCLHLKQPDCHTVCKTFNYFNTYQGSVSITVARLFHKMSSTSVIWSTDITVNSLYLLRENTFQSYECSTVSLTLKSMFCPLPSCLFV